MGYVYVAITVLLTVYGQLVLKWQVGLASAPAAGAGGKMQFIAALLFNPWVVSALTAALAASFSWMLALTKLPLSTAYPMTSASFLIVLVASIFFLGEAATFWKLLGTLLVVAGVVIIATRG